MEQYVSRPQDPLSGGLSGERPARECPLAVRLLTTRRVDAPEPENHLKSAPKRRSHPADITTNVDLPSSLSTGDETSAIT